MLIATLLLGMGEELWVRFVPILPATLKRNGDGRVSGELVTIDVNYGYDRYTQLSVEIPIPYAEGKDGTRQFGVGMRSSSTSDASGPTKPRVTSVSILKSRYRPAASCTAWAQAA